MEVRSKGFRSQLLFQKFTSDSLKKSIFQSQFTYYQNFILDMSTVHSVKRKSSLRNTQKFNLNVKNKKVHLNIFSSPLFFLEVHFGFFESSEKTRILEQQKYVYLKLLLNRKKFRKNTRDNKVADFSQLSNGVSFASIQ